MFGNPSSPSDRKSSDFDRLARLLDSFHPPWSLFLDFLCALTCNALTQKMRADILSGFFFSHGVKRSFAMFKRSSLM